MRRFAATCVAAALLAAAPGDAAAAAAALASALPRIGDDADAVASGGEAAAPPRQLRGLGEAAEARAADTDGPGVALVRHRSQHHAGASRRVARHDTRSVIRQGGAQGAAKEPKAVCVDAPGDWSSKTSSSCADYARFHWCTSGGEYGDGWGDNGDFKDWASATGISAVDACCTCGGGDEVDITVAKLGEEKCPSGDTIMDVATCQAVSRSLGANFASAAQWPEGHPRGCHTDERRSNVWLNTDSAGAGGQEDDFALLCASERQAESIQDNAEEDGGEDDEEEEEDEDEDGDGGKEESNKEASGEKKENKWASTMKAVKDTLREQVVHTHAALVKNMKRRVQIGLELRKLDDEAASKKDIDRSMEAVAHETKSQAMANLLGDMWREMRMFATPFYEERLDEELVNLEHQEPSLEDNYEKAKAALAAAELPGRGAL